MKKFKIDPKDIKQLLDWDEASGCIATDKIVVDGFQVGYMYREKPNEKYLIFFAIYKSNLYISIHWFNYIKIEFTSFVNTFFIS